MLRSRWLSLQGLGIGVRFTERSVQQIELQFSPFKLNVHRMETVELTLVTQSAIFLTQLGRRQGLG